MAAFQGVYACRVESWTPPSVIERFSNGSILVDYFCSVSEHVCTCEGNAAEIEEHLLEDLQDAFPVSSKHEGHDDHMLRNESL